MFWGQLLAFQLQYVMLGFKKTKSTLTHHKTRLEVSCCASSFAILALQMTTHATNWPWLFVAIHLLCITCMNFNVPERKKKNLYCYQEDSIPSVHLPLVECSFVVVVYICKVQAHTKYVTWWYFFVFSKIFIKYAFIYWTYEYYFFQWSIKASF